ncbi:MAG: hypothetical protein AAF492_06330, partial [Verrucomicrobiota bacterium]
AGMGFEADVIDASRGIRRLRGQALYLSATLKSVSRGVRTRNITWSGRNGEDELPARTQTCSMLSFANGARTGGGLRILPSARPADGQMDLGIIGTISRWEILGLLKKLLKGKHLDHPRFTASRFTELQVEADSPFPLHADGEFLTNDVRKLKIRILPRELEVIVG